MPMNHTPSSPRPVGSAPSGGNPGKWKLSWSDEFEDSGPPDPAKWSFEEGFKRNREEQYYTRDRKENLRVENGVLVIEGRKESYKNSFYEEGSADWRKNQEFADYTSASIHTREKASFLYGRFEVRAKMPRGNGTWPAIWTLGANGKEVGWPRCGEIDILEYVGKMPNTLHANNHFADPMNPAEAVHIFDGGGTMNLQEPYNDFHIYAIEWNEKTIRFFADGISYASFTIDRAGKGANNPFRKPHYLLLNLALGGTFGGEIDDSIFPQRYEIDYVRVYTKAPK